MALIRSMLMQPATLDLGMNGAERIGVARLTIPVLAVSAARTVEDLLASS